MNISKIRIHRLKMTTQKRSIIQSKQVFFLTTKMPFWELANCFLGLFELAIPPSSLGRVRKDSKLPNRSPRSTR